MTRCGRRLRDGLLRRLAPQVCVLCGGGGQAERGVSGMDLCEHCEAALPRRPPAWESLDAGPGGGFHLLAPFDYRPPADFMIRQLKFANDLCQARVLGDLLAEARLDRGAPLPSMVVPVPLHWERLRERGYNQAAEIARQAARRLALPVCARVLERRRDTAAQSGLGAAARAGNVAEAFVARREAAGAIGKKAVRVALVDDVVTTGSTAREAAQVLCAAGFREVEVWAVCRAGRPAPPADADQNVSFTPA